MLVGARVATDLLAEGIATMFLFSSSVAAGYAQMRGHATRSWGAVQ